MKKGYTCIFSQTYVIICDNLAIHQVLMFNNKMFCSPRAISVFDRISMAIEFSDIYYFILLFQQARVSGLKCLVWETSIMNLEFRLSRFALPLVTEMEVRPHY